MFTTLIQMLDFFIYGHIRAYAIFYILTLIIFLLELRLVGFINLISVLSVDIPIEMRV